MTWIYFKRRARDAGGKSEIVIYPEAPQGFHADHWPGRRRMEENAG